MIEHPRMLGADHQRARGVLKWSVDRDITPLTIAEADVVLAQPIQDALSDAVHASATGPVSDTAELFGTLADFASQRWAWEYSPGNMVVAPSVNAALVALVRVHVPLGGIVGYSSPVYSAFKNIPSRAGAMSLDIPMLQDAHGWRLDLDHIESAFADERVRGYLLCNPQNPTGHVHAKEDLQILAESAIRHGVVVFSDDVHAPLVYDGRYHPFISCSKEAAAIGSVVASASKGWNLSGVNCAVIITSSRQQSEALLPIREELRWDTSRLGVVAATAAFGRAVAWLDGFVDLLVGQASEVRRRLVTEQLGIEMFQPEASYLAWLDFRALEWDDEPASKILQGTRVALSGGRSFGPAGAGHCRLNFATDMETLVSALDQIAAFVGSMNS